MLERSLSCTRQCKKKLDYLSQSLSFFTLKVHILREMAPDLVSERPVTKMYQLGARFFPLKKQAILPKKVYVRELVEFHSEM